MNVLIPQLLTDTSQIVLPAWATALISVIISTIVTGFIGYTIHRSLDRYFNKKEAHEKEVHKKLMELDSHKEEEKREQIRADIISIVKAEIAPINEKIDVLMDKMTKTEDGTLSSLRNDILTCYYRCLEKGYRGDWDFENIHHLYEAYKELHGNSFVHDVMNRFDELPTKEEYTVAKETKRKKTKADKSEEDF